jgi:predicted ATPase
MIKQNEILLKRITISGFKSFSSDEHTIEFGDVSVLIGANGAGKSNLVSFFKMLGYMMTAALQQYIGQQGGANSILNFGCKHTPKMTAKMEFENGHIYEFTLVGATQDTMMFTDEIIHDSDFTYTFPSGLKESGLKSDEYQNVTPAIMISTVLSNCKVYQFHDTSATSHIRNSSYINQNDFLYSDGGNLAAFLFGLKENETTLPYYKKIVRHIKRVFPDFRDFALHPSARNNNYIMLDWVGNNSLEYKLGAHQLSDGTIRFMALAALLLQQPENLPSVIVLDEPELGLHPSAIVELASMVKIACQHTQVVLATQSPALLDEFTPEQITVIELDPVSKSSIFKRFTEDDLKFWLEDYSLSEIWDKNILGGKP